MKQSSNETMKYWKLLFSILILAAFAIWLAVWSFPDNRLHFITCNVGQGDALLAVTGRNQILIDGGPDNSVLDCLSRHVPFWDQEIELVILTHPEADHFTGLIEVFRRYKVDTFLASGIDNSSQGYQALIKAVGGQGVKVINPVEGEKIRIGLMQLDILWPSEEFVLANSNSSDNNVAMKQSNNSSSVLGASTTKLDLNQFSVMSELTYGNFSALLTGDLQPPVINQTISSLLTVQPPASPMTRLDLAKRASSQGGSSHIAILKVPHHGSKNGLTKEFLDVVNPQLAVISVGKNQWGHPHEEIIKLLNDKMVEILRTDKKGDIEVISNEEEWWVNN